MTVDLDELRDIEDELERAEQRCHQIEYAELDHRVTDLDQHLETLQEARERVRKLRHERDTAIAYLDRMEGGDDDG